jgi:hypothetical protein
VVVVVVVVVVLILPTLLNLLTLLTLPINPLRCDCGGVGASTIPAAATGNLPPRLY